MELDTLIDLMFSNKTSAYAGFVQIKDMSVNIQAEMKADQQGNPLIIFNLLMNKTNVGVTASYIVDFRNDKRDDVINDIETMVSYLYFGVEKVAKKIVPPPKDPIKE